MFKQGSNLLLKFSKGFKIPKGFISVAKNVPLNYSFAWNQIGGKVKSLNRIPKYNFASLPNHQKLTMPALSPTMKKGNLVKWNFKVGDAVNPGDAICDIETDKATLSFEMQDSGYLAKILIPEGTKDIEVGKPIAIVVDNKADLAAFKDYSESEASASQQTINTSSQSQQGTTEHHNIRGIPRSNVSIRFSHSKGSESHEAPAQSKPQQSRPQVSLPPHSKLTMPALSPTMKAGKIAKWHKKVGDKVNPDDVLADVETDKATVDFAYQDEGYIAKILVPEGTSDVPVGQLVAIVVDKKEDIAKFEDISAEDILGGGKAQAQQTVQTQAPSQATQSRASAPTRGSGERVFASPLAKKIAAEKGIDLSQIRGSGPEGRILKHDVEEQAASLSQRVETQQAQPTTEKKPEKKVEKEPKFVEAPNPYIDIPVSNMRDVIAKRLLESKTTIPHYYLTSEIVMDKIIKIREELNKEAKTKISFNDIFIKAAALACVEVPEVNSQWQGTVIRRFKNADVSVAVDTGSGLITPIIFNANSKGLNEISLSMKDLADRAKKNALKPHEFIGGTFSISNLGMMGVTSFAAVINPPQACILAIGKTDSKLVQEGDQIKSINVMKVTLSCDHRVVDGAVGAKWLQKFKSYLEKPETMLL